MKNDTTATDAASDWFPKSGNSMLVLDELRRHVRRFLTVDGAACEANDAVRVAELFKALDEGLSAGGPLPAPWNGRKKGKKGSSS